MKPTRFSPKLLQGRFARRLTLLSGGTFIGQAILMLSSPILTRLYTPEQFGALSVFTALSSMMIVVITLRYEYAVPVCREVDDALAVLAVSCIVVTLLAILIGVAVFIGGNSFADTLGLEGFESLIWLLPPMLWLWGLSLPLSAWSVRQGSFRLNAASSLGQFAVQAVAQVALGLAGGGAGSLVLGYAMGPVPRLAALSRALSAADRARMFKLPWARIWAAAREHWRYPVFSGSSSLLQSASQMLPAVFIAALYGPVAAGLFGLTQRIMGAPVRMLSEAASSSLSRRDRAGGRGLHLSPVQAHGRRLSGGGPGRRGAAGAGRPKPVRVRLRRALA